MEGENNEYQNFSTTVINPSDIRQNNPFIYKEEEDKEQNFLNKAKQVLTGKESKQEIGSDQEMVLKNKLPEHLKILSTQEKKDAEQKSNNTSGLIKNLEKTWEDKVNKASLPFAIWRYLPRDIQNLINSYIHAELPILHELQKLVLHSAPCTTLIETVNIPIKITIYTDKIITTEWNFDQSNVIRIYDIRTHKLLNELKGHTSSITAITADYNKIISGSKDGIIKIWNLETGDCLKTLNGHNNAIKFLSLASEHRLASYCSGRNLKIWNIETGIQLSTSTFDAPLDFLTMDLKTKGCAFQLYNDIHISTGKKPITLRGHTAQINKLLYVDNIAFSCSDDGTLKAWNLENQKCKATYANDQRTPLKTFSLIEINNSVYFITIKKDNIIELWSIKNQSSERLECKLADKISCQNIASWSVLANTHNIDLTSELAVHDNKLYLTTLTTRATNGAFNGYIRVWDFEAYKKINKEFFDEFSFLEINLLKKLNNAQENEARVVLTKIETKLFISMVSRFKKKFGREIMNTLANQLCRCIEFTSLLYADWLWITKG